MHPPRTKSALVKRDLHVLQDLIGSDEDALLLINMARARVKKRVVVKWPQKVPPVLMTKEFIPGKTIRFDIYAHST
jgi:16S rRNA (guanine1516-N2)-methyltransferase